MSGFIAPHLTSNNFGATLSPLSSAHAFNLAAFRSPGFLGAHGFAAFGANIGAYRDQHSPSNSFDSHAIHTTNALNVTNPNSNSPTNHYSSTSVRNCDSPKTRDGYLSNSSDYYHHNNNSSKLNDVHNHSNGDFGDTNHERYSSSLHQNNNNNNNHSSSNNNNNNHSLINNNHHNFERNQSESPELSVNDQRCSPVDSSRSYPTSQSQKSDEGFNSPTRPDSVGSRSPENLCAGGKKSSEMLDHHKLPLSFLGPPLAALHSMTEMKSSNGNLNGNGHNSSMGNSPGSGGLQHTQSQIGAHGTANPHGIDTILSRPTPVTTAGLNALASGKW